MNITVLLNKWIILKIKLLNWQLKPFPQNSIVPHILTSEFSKLLMNKWHQFYRTSSRKTKKEGEGERKRERK